MVNKVFYIFIFIKIKDKVKKFVFTNLLNLFDQ